MNSVVKVLMVIILGAFALFGLWRVTRWGREGDATAALRERRAAEARIDEMSQYFAAKNDIDGACPVPALEETLGIVISFSLSSTRTVDGMWLRTWKGAPIGHEKLDDCLQELVQRTDWTPFAFDRGTISFTFQPGIGLCEGRAWRQLPTPSGRPVEASEACH